jgi:hypothetical protein
VALGQGATIHHGIHADALFLAAPGESPLINQKLNGLT